MDSPAAVRPAPAAGAVFREAPSWRPAMLAWQLPMAILLMGLGVWAGVGVPMLPVLGWLAATTPELVRIDLAAHRLPDRLTLPGYPLALGGVAVAALLGDPMLPPVAVGAGFLVLFLLLSVGGGMGLGDVKLAGVLGLVLGTMSPSAGLAALLLAFLTGGVAALLTLSRRGRSARLAFGPFLLAGFWASLPLA